jgi:hypothetical protein
MKLSVYEDKGLKELAEVMPIDILFFEYREELKKVIVHTRSKEYYLTGSINYWHDLVKINGFRFMRSDRNSSINMDQVRAADFMQNCAYFDSNPTPDSKRCAFSGVRFMQLLEKLEMPLSRLNFAKKRKEIIII